MTLRLGWTYIGGFSPLYLGVDKGFFREQGIDLKILEGKGTVPSAATVANGSDDFGYFDIGSVSLLIDKGLAVRGIAQIRQKTGAAYISMKKPASTALSAILAEEAGGRRRPSYGFTPKS